MSFLGCIGHLMAGSGLQDVLELVYAKNAVTHMMSGKAVSRAVRGHFLVDSALQAILVSNTFDLPLPEKIKTTPANEESADLVNIQEASTSEMPSEDPNVLSSDPSMKTSEIKPHAFNQVSNF